MGILGRRSPKISICSWLLLKPYYNVYIRILQGTARFLYVTVMRKKNQLLTSLYVKPNRYSIFMLVWIIAEDSC